MTTVAKPRAARRPAAKKPVEGKVGPFKKARVLKEWDNGYRMVYIYSIEDMAILGKHGGGCSPHHWVWTQEIKSEYFIVLVNAKDEVGTILFCKDAQYEGKKHPEDAKGRKMYREKMDDLNKVVMELGDRYEAYPFEIASDYYDSGMHHSRYGNDVAYYEKEYLRVKDQYEGMKARAIEEHGPLGKDHPMKAELDDLNRYVTENHKTWQRELKRNEVTAGRHFMFDDVELAIIQVAGRGVDYDAGKNTRYTDKVAEFVNERRVESVTT